MIYGSAPTFKEILETLKEFEKELNRQDEKNR